MFSLIIVVIRVYYTVLSACQRTLNMYKENIQITINYINPTYTFFNFERLNKYIMTIQG